MSTLAEVTSKALALNVEERVLLAQRIWDSVEHFTSREVEKAWLDEAGRRWREIETGKVQVVAGEDVMKRARESLTR